jgi:CheY-like chemotaxis protein
LNKYRLEPGMSLMPNQPLRGFVILVVEDDPDTLAAVSYLISEAFGCRVLRASSVDYALRMIDSGSRVDLVFSDVGMPGVDGLTLAELVRRRRPDLPFVLVTGRPDVVDAALKAGRVALLKPYTVETLAAVFSEQLHVDRSLLSGTSKTDR